MAAARSLGVRYSSSFVFGAGLLLTACSGGSKNPTHGGAAGMDAPDAGADGGPIIYNHSGAGAATGGLGGAKHAGSGGNAGSSDDEAITSISLDPTSATLEVTGSSAQTLQLTARAQPSGATITPVWTLDNTLLGTIDESGVFTTSNTAAGVVHATASYQGFSASAAITVHYAVDITSGNVPSDAPALFDERNKVVVRSTSETPTLVYPVDDTMFPQNVNRVLFQWRGHNKPLFQLEFTSPVLRVATYTDGVHETCTQAQTGGSCWESSAASWTALAASNAGQTVTLKIRALDSATAPTTIFESPSYTIHFSKEPVPGAIYYWSTTVAGVRRGTMGDAGPTNFLTPAEANNKCVACHTLSKKGKLLAADIGGESLGVVQVSASVPPPVNFGPTGTPPTAYKNAWATFDPTEHYVVQSKAGVMTLRDAASGASVGANNGLVPLGTSQYAVQPDWALDGEHMVFAASSGKNVTKDRAGGPLLQWISTTIADTGVSFGAVQTLQPAMTNVLYGYPMFNPTSELISFVRGKTIEKDLTDQIWLARASAAATQVNLVRANTLVSDSLAPLAGVENNMPTWAPSAGSDVQWIAFASKRDYGFVLCSPTGTSKQVCATTSKVGSGKQQIWIAAIDAAKYGTGEDPSYPAFRVPFMELSEDCHRPFWAVDALAPEVPAAGSGGAGGSGGNGGAGGTGGAGGAGGSPAPACVKLDADCSSGICCAGLECTSDVSGDNFTCQAKLQ